MTDYKTLVKIISETIDRISSSKEMLTPYLIVDTNTNGVIAPTHLASSTGHIIFNISGTAVRNFLINEDGVSFSATFSGQRQSVFAPLIAIKGVYAKENPSICVVFDDLSDLAIKGSEESEKPKKQRPQLKIVK